LVFGILIGGYLFGLFSKLSNKITHFQVVAHKGVSDLFQVITHDGVDNLLFVMLFNVTRSDSHWVQMSIVSCMDVS
jgi:hypothetical protein